MVRRMFGIETRCVANPSCRFHIRLLLIVITLLVVNEKIKFKNEKKANIRFLK